MVYFIKQVTILMDAGEGALGQLQRIFGRAGAGKVVANLDLVWVSHRYYKLTIPNFPVMLCCECSSTMHKQHC